jgi:RNA polymerase sigma-70 factor (ECF subfamily)
MSAPADWIETCVARFERPLTVYAWRLLGDADDARDAVQDTFLRLCRQDRGDIDSRLAEWLFTVCRHCAIDRLRKDRPMHPLAEPQLAEPSPAAAPAVVMEQEETLQGVLSALAGLPSNQQECIRLKFQQGLSYQEISRITNLSVSNVGYLIHMGIKSLRARFAPALGAPHAPEMGSGGQS